MIGACKLTVSLPNDAVDDFQKDILKPTDQVLFLTTPHDTPYHPINCEPPCTNGVADSLWVTLVILEDEAAVSGWTDTIATEPLLDGANT